MDAFDYAALDKNGKRQRGTVMATSIREARDILRSRSLSPIDLDPARADKQQRRPALARRVNHKDITQTTRQIAFLIGAATPVEEALKMAALQFNKSPIRDVLLDVRAQVLEGARLSDALRAHPKTFSPLYTAMVASGETSGNLASVLERLANDLEAAQKIRRKILGATAYPMVLSVVAIAVVVVLMVFVVPKVVAQFDSFGQELPLLTQWTIGFSNGLKKWGIVAMAFLVALGFLANRLLKRPGLRRRVDRRVLQLPLLGATIRNLNAARFARTMAGLIDSGTPTLTALEIARYTLGNLIMQDAVTTAATKVREGGAMSAALKTSAVFPPLLVQMVAGGEASGQVGVIFAKSADYLEGEFEGTMSIVLSLLEPLIIILLAGIIMVIIAAIFLPILRLNTLAF